MYFKKKPKHIKIEQGIYFVTTHTYNFEPVFKNRKIADTLLNSLSKVQKLLLMPVYAYVILPHHLHLMFGTTEKFDLSYIMFRIKGFSSREINKIRKTSGSVWQDRYQDHVIRNNNDFAKHIDYIHYNPVKHNLIEKPEDWKWSSYQNYLRKRYYEEGWAHREIKGINDLDYELKNSGNK